MQPGDQHHHVYSVVQAAVLDLTTMLAQQLDPRIMHEHVRTLGKELCVTRCETHDQWAYRGMECPDPCSDCTYEDVTLNALINPNTGHPFRPLSDQSPLPGYYHG